MRRLHICRGCYKLQLSNSLLLFAYCLLLISFCPNLPFKINFNFLIPNSLFFISYFFLISELNSRFFLLDSNGSFCKTIHYTMVVYKCFFFFFCLDAKETKNQGQPDRSARLSRPTPPRSLVNSGFFLSDSTITYHLSLVTYHPKK